VIAIANTPSLNASVRPVSHRFPMMARSSPRVLILPAAFGSPRN
jgi:hypothetical protein